MMNAFGRKAWHWLLLSAIVTGLLLTIRTSLDKAHIALAYLLLVLGASARAGHVVGLTIAAVTFVLFDWFFLPPYNTLGIAKPLDWFVLVAFLIVSAVAAQLLRQAQTEAHAARTQANHAEALRESDRLKTSLLASVSHDLRTPLTTIKALAHELAPSDERAWVIEAEADRLNRMVANLLDLSRLQANAVTMHLEVTAVDDLIGATLQRVSGAMPQRAIVVSLPDDATLLVGRFDLAASMRVLVNLIDNAHRHAPLELPIEMRVWRAGPVIHLAVVDRGPGVPPGEAARIFDAFYRPASRSPDIGSAGLGLAIARGLAEAQGGTLRHEETPGGGATFVLTLPAADLPSDFTD